MKKQNTQDNVILEADLSVISETESSRATEYSAKITKTKHKIDWWKVLEYSLPALISIFIFLFALIVKRVHPFGDNTLAIIDYNDGLVPAYTNLWDILHGDTSCLVNWNLGGGGSIITAAVINTWLSPISWLIAIFPRAYVVHGVAFLLIVKYALMATTAYICFKKYFSNVSKWVLLLFCLIWTFSGWTLVHFTNIGWLDIMILLPLLLISAKRLVKEGKIFWFVIILSYMLMLSYYISYMVLVATVVIATVYVFTLAENKKRVASSLFFAIIISILISAVAFIPSMYSSLQGYRFSNSASSGRGELFEYFFSKVSVVIMFALPIVFFMRLMFTYKKDKKPVLFFMLSFIICGIGLLIEPINKMWHTGSYLSFPIRYGFVLIMILIFGALYYINKYMSKDYEEVELAPNKGENKKGVKIDWMKVIGYPCLGGSVLITGFLAYVGNKIIPYQTLNFMQFAYYFLLFVFTYVAIEFCLRIKNKKLFFAKLNGGLIIFILTIAQILALTIGYTGNIAQNNQRVTNVYEIDTSILEDGYKLKDRENIYNYNFPQLINYGSLTTWIHISPAEQNQALINLGYGHQSTTIMSGGGTMLTDALLGNKYVLSREILNPTYYTLVDQIDFVAERVGGKQIVYLYEYAFELNKAFTTDVDLTTVLGEEEDLFVIQNKLFKVLYNSVENIITDTTYTITEEEECFTITVAAPANQNLLMYIKGGTDTTKLDTAYNIEINGFERDVTKGLVDLGFSDSGVIEFKFDKDDYLTIEDIKSMLKFGSFNSEMFVTAHNALSNDDVVDVDTSGSQVKVSINNTQNKKYALVPYVTLKNIVAENNGKEIEVKNAFGSFMFVELTEGENEITFTYKPQLVNVCLIVTIVALVIFAIFSILNWKFDLASKKWVCWIGTIGACVILAAVGFLVYLKPFFNFFVILFKG